MTCLIICPRKTTFWSVAPKQNKWQFFWGEINFFDFVFINFCTFHVKKLEKGRILGPSGPSGYILAGCCLFLAKNRILKFQKSKIFHFLSKFWLQISIFVQNRPENTLNCFFWGEGGVGFFNSWKDVFYSNFGGFFEKVKILNFSLFFPFIFVVFLTKMN